MRSPFFAVLAAARADVAVAILLPLNSAGASDNLSVDPSSMGEWLCVTALGTQSQVVVPTFTDTDVETVYLPWATEATTIHQTLTIQETPLTITNTDTVLVTETVTDSTVTGTFSTTETETVMLTTTETTGIIETDITASTTTTTSTANVPAPTWFVGIRDTINGYPGQSPNKKRNVPDRLRERWLRVCPASPSQSTSSVGEEPTSEGHPTPSPSPTSTGSVYSEVSSNLASTESVYSIASSSSDDDGFLVTDFPQSVECRSTTTVQSTFTVTEEGDTIIITSTPPVETTEVTTTETTTSTIVPDEVAVTESFDTVVTSTSTSTVITTTTTTSTLVEEATSTVESYETCGAQSSTRGMYMYALGTSPVGWALSNGLCGHFVNAGVW